NCTACPTLAGFGDAVKLACGAGGNTVTTVDADPDAPHVSVTETDAVYVPDAVYRCCTLAVAPASLADCPSPKLNNTRALADPVDGVAVIANVTGLFGVALALAEIVGVKGGRGATVKLVEAAPLFPQVSVSVKVAV